MLCFYKRELYIKLLQNGDIGADEFDKFFYCFDFNNEQELSNIESWFLETILEEIADNKIGRKKALGLLNELTEEIKMNTLRRTYENHKPKEQ